MRRQELRREFRERDIIAITDSNTDLGTDAEVGVGLIPTKVLLFGADGSRIRANA